MDGWIDGPRGDVWHCSGHGMLANDYLWRMWCSTGLVVGWWAEAGVSDGFMRPGMYGQCLL
jgi:hypothetical protein